MIRASLLSILLLVPACGKTPVPTAPMIAASAVPAPKSGDPPAVASTTPEPCSKSFVEIHDGGTLVRYEHGRESVPGKRGATHAYAEAIRHPNGYVLHLDALSEANGRRGHLSLAILQFRAPEALPASYETAYGEYLPPDRDMRDERRLDSTHVELTRWGDVGEWIEGTFRGPIEGRFHVCRTADWDAGKK